MAERATTRVDATREVLAESLRLTAFLAPSAQVVDPPWWSGLVGAQPEIRTSKPSRGELQEAGPLGERTLTLSVLPGRVDWFLTPRIEPGAVPETRWAGRFEETAGEFSELMVRWLRDCPPLVRLGFGGTAHELMPDKAAAYRRLAEYLSAVKLDPENSQDFLYQINRPRNSAVIEGLRINRLSKWSAAQFLPIRIAITPQQVVQFPVVARDQSCRIEVDINSDPAFPGELPSEQLPGLFGELRDLALEVITRGDIP